MKVMDRVQDRAWPFALPEGITVYHVLLGGIILAVVFTRFFRLEVPGEFYFDEVYFPDTARRILQGDATAWEFYGAENTHPPLSKLFMALGMVPFGQESAFGWRFFGALAGVGSVVFMYLLGKRLFRSEIAGLAAAFILTFEGLAFAQSRIATPDTYVLFFVLGTVYFMVSDRFLLAGIFFGAAVATKWNAAFVAVPIVLYFAWSFLRRLLESEREQRLRDVEIVLFAGLGVAALAAGGAAAIYFITDNFYLDLMLVAAIGLVALIAALAVILLNGEMRRSERGQLYLHAAASFPVFFMLIPAAVYALTYVPMLIQGYGPGHAVDLNRAAYEFHSNLDAGHPYESRWYTWPVMHRPIYMHLGSSGERIYSLGNPVVFWMVIPALVFALWQGLRYVRAKIDPLSGHIALAGRLGVLQMGLLFVVLVYLGFWLPWAAQPRIMFIYHYLPALAFGILALGYAVHWLWHHPQQFGRPTAIAILAGIGLTFLYFYPHLAAVDAPRWLSDSYFWFDSWR